MFYVQLSTTDDTVDFWVFELQDMYERILHYWSDCDIIDIVYYDYSDNVRYVHSVPVDIHYLVDEYRKAMFALPRALDDKGYVIERTRCRRGGHHCFRRPKTMRSRRILQSSEHFDGIPLRAKQRHLPTAWDDIMHSDVNHHNWKRHRSTQYR